MQFEQAIRAAVELAGSDDSFQFVGRHLRGSICFKCSDDRFVVDFSRGIITSVYTASDVDAHWDYEISGSSADWSQVLSGDVTMSNAFVPALSDIRVSGDLVAWASQAELLSRFGELLVAAAAGRTPPPGFTGLITTTAAVAAEAEVVGRYATVSGARTYYEDTASEGDITFLGVHTAGRDGRQWQSLARLLAPYGRFIAPDLPGHGKSWPYPGRDCLRSIPEMADFLWELLEAVSPDGRIVLVGCSIGANIVLQMALDPARSSTTHAVVALEGAAYTPTQSPTAVALMRHPTVNIEHSYRDRTVSLTGRQVGAREREYLLWEATCYSSVTLQADLLAYGSFDIRERLGQIDLPVLLARGTDDWLVNEAMVAETASRLPDARLVSLEGLGHFPHVEDPQRCADVISEFLTGVRSA